MTGICGWYSPAGALSASMDGDLIEEMARFLPGVGDDVIRREGEGSAVVAARGNGAACLADGAILAAIDGRPRWEDREIARIAAAEGPAHALVAAYRKLGPALTDILRGAWSFALIDRASDTCLLAIDRFGRKPLCHARARGETVVFGTTVSAVGAFPSVDTGLDAQGLFNFLFFTRVPAPGTIMKGIDKLVSGYMTECRGDRHATRRYWRLSYLDRGRGDAASLSVALRQSLEDAVTNELAGAPAGRPVGAFLSGGLDSSTVCGMLARVATGPAVALSIGFDVEGYDEMRFAQAAADHFGMRLISRYLGPSDVVTAVPVLARAYDEPFGNSSAVAAYHCAKMAAEEGIDRLLAGDGGDELFAGNQRYLSQQVFQYYGFLPSYLRQGLIEPALGWPWPDIGLLRKARAYVRRANIPLPDRLESYNPYWGAAALSILDPELAASVDPLDALRVMRHHYDETDAVSPLNRMMHLDLRTTLADDDLRKVVRTAEILGLEVGFPMLDEGVAEVSARIPVDLKLKPGRLRHFYRQALSDFLPPTSLAKRKHGFALPFGAWLHTDRALQELVFDAIASLKTRRIFSASFLDQALQQFKTGHPSVHGEVLWVLMMAEFWLAGHRERHRRAQVSAA